MEKLKKMMGLRTLKTALGAALAIFLSQKLGLSYAVNSAIIVILSVQTTKRKSRDLALMRLGSTVLALFVGSVTFRLVGFTPWAFGIYLLIFIPLAVKLKFHDGIVPCSVLVSHLLAVESVAWAWLGNEMMQMVIGAGIGFLLNLQMPSEEKKLRANIEEIEKLMGELLLQMADHFQGRQRPENEEKLHRTLEKKLQQTQELALREAGNHFTRDLSGYAQYVEMRMGQQQILKYMRKYARKGYHRTKQAEMIAQLIQHVAAELNALEVHEEVRQEIERYRNTVKQEALPQTLEELECWASLDEFVRDLEYLLELKRDFVESLDSQNRESLLKPLEEIHSAA